MSLDVDMIGEMETVILLSIIYVKSILVTTKVHVYTSLLINWNLQIISLNPNRISPIAVVNV